MAWQPDFVPDEDKVSDESGLVGLATLVWTEEDGSTFEFSSRLAVLDPGATRRTNEVGEWVDEPVPPDLTRFTAEANAARDAWLEQRASAATVEAQTAKARDLILIALEDPTDARLDEARQNAAVARQKRQ